MKISVCMAVRNGERFLQEQVASILPQLSAGDELVVSDDGSTDRSLDIIRSFGDPRIRILPAQQFNNPNHNFAYGLRHCTGDLIFIADQDDVWMPDKVDVMQRALGHADLVVSDCRIVDAAGQVIHPSLHKLQTPHSGVLFNILRSSFVGCCMAFHKIVLVKALPFPEHAGIYDQWIGLMGARYFRIAFIPDILVSHRRHGGNFSTTSGKSRNPLNKRLMNRYFLIKNLLHR